MANLLIQMCENSAGKFDLPELLKHAKSAPLSYKQYQIPKKNGGVREIAQPTEFVKSVQRAICDTYLDELPISEYAMAYQKNTSIVKNALPHKNNNWILKIDFSNFFPSIRPVDLFKFLERKIELNEFEKHIIGLYLFKRTNGQLRLSIGAPSSPLISNIIMYDIDHQLGEICSNKNIKYTRYADDLTFSSNDVDTLNQLPDMIKNILVSEQYPKLFINQSKTKIIGRGRSRRVTGVVISNENQLTAGRYKRKKIRALLHLYVSEKIKKDDIPYLHGLLSFVRGVEPAFFDKVNSIYGIEVVNKLAKDAYVISKAKKKAIINATPKK